MKRSNRAATTAARKRRDDALAAIEAQRKWLYHPTLAPKIFVGTEAVEAAEADGWKDSPAKCDGFLDKVPIDRTNPLQVQLVGEITQQTTEATNLLENIETLTGPQLNHLAELQLGADWSKRRDTIVKRRAHLVELLAAQTAAAEDTDPTVVAVVPEGGAE